MNVFKCVYFTVLLREMEDQGLNSILVKNSRNGKNGGFRVTLLDRELSDQEKHILVCSACGGILREPVLVKDAFKCNACIEMEEVVISSIPHLTQKLQIDCPYKVEGCTWNDSITKLIDHRNLCEGFLQEYPNCPNTVIECSFKQYGCEVETERKYMHQHEKDNKTYHMKLMDKHIRTKDDTMENLITELLAIKKQLKEVVTEMKYTCGGIVFELPGIKEKIKNDRTYQITAFYVGFYKFQASIYSKFNNENMIAVFVKIQRGTFDNDVIWPFCGKVSISLINKADENLSVLRSFRTEGNSAFEKGGHNCNPVGILDFATHETILKEEYSKGDSIKIKFLVQFDAQQEKYRDLCI